MSGLAVTRRIGAGVGSAEAYGHRSRALRPALRRQGRQASPDFRVEPCPVDAVERVAALRRFDQQLALDLAALERGRVGHAPERHHRVARDEAVRMALRPARVRARAAAGSRRRRRVRASRGSSPAPSAWIACAFGRRSASKAAKAAARSAFGLEVARPATRSPRTRSSCPGRGTAPSRARRRRAARRDRRACQRSRYSVASVPVGLRFEVALEVRDQRQAHRRSRARTARARRPR